MRDNGPGFRRDEATRIFEPFYTTKSGGSGIGLALAKLLAEAHGGWIGAGRAGKRRAGIVMLLPRPVSAAAAL